MPLLVELLRMILCASLVTWGKEFACQDRRHRFNPWVGRILWSRKWQPTPVFLPEESHGERSLVGYGPKCH